MPGRRKRHSYKRGHQYFPPYTKLNYFNKPDVREPPEVSQNIGDTDVSVGTGPWTRSKLESPEKEVRHMNFEYTDNDDSQEYLICNKSMLEKLYNNALKSHTQ